MTNPFSAPDWHLSDFDFDLPESSIAAHPVTPRDHARLLHVTQTGLADRHIYDLPDILRAGDILVMNDTKVVPARLYGQRDAVKIEVLLNKAEQGSPLVWSALARPGKRLKIGQHIVFAEGFSAEVLEKREGGEIIIRFDAGSASLFEQLHKHGHIPLPPYIKRPEGDTEEDRQRYQTIYAAHEGAVAAPTAGLHFTPELFTKLDALGVTRTTVTLHVGAGTFLPVKTERVADHKMHAEWGEISAETAALLSEGKKQGRRIVAVGTTSLRLLESAADENGHIRPFAAETDIFITPGYRFRAVDAMLTNFHLPKSTLFMLVSALAGMQPMRDAYRHAIADGYRFYSYGDACFLEKA